MTTKQDADHAAILFRHSVELMDAATNVHELTAARAAILDGMVALVDVARLGAGYLALIDTEIAETQRD